MTDLAAVRPYQRRTDAVILDGGDTDTAVRVVVRPSGTEPKVKSYIEVRRTASTAIWPRPARMPDASTKSWPESRRLSV